MRDCLVGSKIGAAHLPLKGKASAHDNLLRTRGTRNALIFSIVPIPGAAICVSVQPQSETKKPLTSGAKSDILSERSKDSRYLMV